MIKEKIGEPKGFQVIHKYGRWRIACHAYEESINSIHALKNWGVHVESDEAFVLVKGKAVLATAGTLEEPMPAMMEEIRQGILYVVQQGERHAIALAEDTAVLIIENRDMSNFVEAEMGKREVEAFRTYFAG